MPHDEYETLGSDPIVRIAKLIVPWVVLVLVLWVFAGIWGSFQHAKEIANATATASTEPTVTPVTAPSTATTVTGMVAVTRVAVQLRAQPDTSAEILATSKKGSTLTVVARQGTWFQVKDKIGHIGWIPNNVQYIDVRAKK